MDIRTVSPSIGSLALAMHCRMMSPTELRDILDELGWSQRDLARVTGRDFSRMHKMARGTAEIDDPLAEWLRRVGELIRNPPERPGKGKSDAG